MCTEKQNDVENTFYASDFYGFVEIPTRDLKDTVSLGLMRHVKVIEKPVKSVTGHRKNLFPLETSPAQHEVFENFPSDNWIMRKKFTAEKKLKFLLFLFR